MDQARSIHEKEREKEERRAQSNEEKRKKEDRRQERKRVRDERDSYHSRETMKETACVPLVCLLVVSAGLLAFILDCLLRVPAICALACLLAPSLASDCLLCAPAGFAC